jgi:hypothetical protein
MSEIMSFGNIVNSLRAVRNDYNEHLKSVPQYEAFLLVESSTQRVADTLQGIISSAAPSMAGEVVAALELAKVKFREHLTSVPEYRALLAIDKLISDVSADLGVVPAQAAPPAQAEPATTETATVARAEAEPVEALAATVPQAEAAVQAPADEAAAAIASIAEAVSAHLEAAEPAPVHASADLVAEAAQQSDHQLTAVPAPEFVSTDTNEVAAEAQIAQGLPPAQAEAFGHEAEPAPTQESSDAPAEVAAQPAEHQEAVSPAPGGGQSPTQPVVILAEDTTEPTAAQPETYGHEAEKAA